MITFYQLVHIIISLGHQNVTFYVIWHYVSQYNKIQQRVFSRGTEMTTKWQTT